MRVKPLLNEKSVQLVITAESELEMGLLKRFINGVDGSGNKSTGGYSASGDTYGYGYESISLVQYDPTPNQPSEEKK